MITIDIKQDERGCIRKCSVSGHSLLSTKGSDILCAAVTILLRTAGRLLHKEKGIGVKGGPETEGEFGFSLLWVSEPAVNRISGISDFLLRGLQDLEAEYPERIKLMIKYPI